MFEIVVPSVFAGYFGLLILSFVVRSFGLSWISALEQASAELSQERNIVFGKTDRFAVSRILVKD